MVATRAQRQEHTRAALLSAARAAFLDHGYAAASLAAIAEAAGCTTGAVYANFAGKDALFAAVLDERAEASRRDQLDAALDAPTLAEALRAVAQVLLDEGDPRWARLGADYWARAAHDEAFRELAARRTDVIVDRVGAIVTELAARHGRTLAIPAREVVRGGGALARGVRLERALGFAENCTPEVFEAMFVAYAQGLMRSRSAGADHQGGSA